MKPYHEVFLCTRDMGGGGRGEFGPYLQKIIAWFMARALMIPKSTCSSAQKTVRKGKMKQVTKKFRVYFACQSADGDRNL